MKNEITEVCSLLDSIEEYLNQNRGIINEEEYSQAHFEDKFMR